MTCQMMMSLGVYVLGAADVAERRQLEAHLPGCRACRAELSRLTPLPGPTEESCGLRSSW